ncbi:MAG: hypothetical protein EA397_15335 [Deltaproteobacteria bacterium]|nr:MAG: hypothetical protein EA397_15335 [Deltaproteobacteria bacterium]
MALTETFLELAPEFGGTRFGPFKGMEIRLGSDPASNDIVLPENLGVLPNHVKLLSQGDGSFVIAPIERTAGVFAFRAGSSAKQVTSPVAAQGASDTYSADSFSLVTPEGPRFYILLISQKGQPKTKESDFDRARKRLSGKSLFSELKRQGLVTFLTTRGGAEIQRWGTFIKTGAILRPRYLISGIAVLAGWLFAGGLGLVACQSAVDAAKKDTELTDCRSEVSMLGGGSEGQGPTLESYAARIIGGANGVDPGVKFVLQQDEEFLNAFRQELTALVNSEDRQNRLRWVYRRNDSDFVQIKNQMQRQGWPEILLRVLPYIAALEGVGADRDWTFIDGDSLGNEVCGRGPMAMTWRQAQQLGVRGLTHDAAADYAKWRAMDREQQAEALRESASTLRGYVPPDSFDELNALQAVNEQNIVCMFEGGSDITEDPRSSNNVAELIQALNPAIGPKAGRFLPDPEDNVGVINRLVRYYAADFNGDFSNLNLTGRSMTPSVALNEVQRVKPYALQQAGAALARAVFIPCMAALDPAAGDLPLDKNIGTPPPPLDCIIIEGMIKYNVR